MNYFNVIHKENLFGLKKYLPNELYKRKMISQKIKVVYVTFMLVVPIKDYL